MQLPTKLHALLNRLRLSGQGDTIASFVDDPLKVRKEMRFLLFRLVVLLGIAIALIAISIMRVRGSVRAIEQRRALTQATYRRFDTMTRLSHDVDEGRVALAKVQKYIAREQQLLDVVRAFEKIAKETENAVTLLVNENVSQPALDLPGYRFVTFTGTLTGTMRSFLLYLDAFRGFPYLAILDRVEMQGESGLENKGTTLTLFGRLYVQ